MGDQLTSLMVAGKVSNLTWVHVDAQHGGRELQILLKH